MPYIFKGNLCGFICDDCKESLSNVTVRLYRTRPEQPVTPLAVANPKDTLAVLTDEMVERKRAALISEVQTDDEGNFSFGLDEDKHQYKGEAFEIDVYCGSVPRQKIGPKKPTPRQFTITTLQPLWRQTPNGLVWSWEYCIPDRFWCGFRGLFGAWVICGKVVDCKTKQPVPNLRVKAFDSDWITDDALGQDITNALGRFRIDYATTDFRQTSFIPLNIDTPWFGYDSGPDVYFIVETLGGVQVLNEGRPRGLQADRANRGPCFCVEICVEPGTIVPTPEATPHWTRVEYFNVHPVSTEPQNNFLPEGYAGLPSQAFVFGGDVSLFGNCPLRNAAIPTNPLKYRFRFAEWTWVGGGDGTAGVMPTVPPPAPSLDPSAWRVVTPGNPDSLGNWVGTIYYNDGVNPFASASVKLSVADQDVEGFIKLEGKTVTVPMSGGGTSTISITPTNFLRSGFLMAMNTGAITSLHSARFPAWGSNKQNAGRSLAAAEQEPIRRYRIIFEVRDAVTNLPVFDDVLDSIVLDNSAVVALLNLQELLTSACNPVSGLSEIHLRYTVDHPHLRFFKVEISNNSGVVHAAPPLPNGNFTPGNYFFRGGASGPMVFSDPGGTPVNITGDPVCAYSVVLTWQTRHLYTGTSSTQILYCK